MKQMQIKPESRIDIDFQDWPLITATQKLQPVVFKVGDSFCCLLGPDPNEGIFGCGSTAYEAVTDWEQHLHDRLAADSPEDEVTEYVKKTLKIENNF